MYADIEDRNKREREARRVLTAAQKEIEPTPSLLYEAVGLAGVVVWNVSDLNRAAGGKRKRSTGVDATSPGNKLVFKHLNAQGKQLYSRYGSASEFPGCVAVRPMSESVWSQIHGGDHVVVADPTTELGQDLMSGRAELPSVAPRADTTHLQAAQTARIGNLRDVDEVQTWLLAVMKGKAATR